MLPFKIGLGTDMPYRRGGLTIWLAQNDTFQPACAPQRCLFCESPHL
jgi:hypothetical protein